MIAEIDPGLESAVEDRLSKVRDSTTLRELKRQELLELAKIKEDIGAHISPEDVLQITVADNFFVAFSDGFVAPAYRKMMGVWDELRFNFSKEMDKISQYANANNQGRSKKPLKEIYRVIDFISRRNPNYIEETKSYARAI